MGDFISSLVVASAWPQEEIDVFLPASPILSSAEIEVRFPSVLYTTFIDDEYFGYLKLEYQDFASTWHDIPALDPQTYTNYPNVFTNRVRWDVDADRTKADFRIIDSNDTRRGFVILPSCVIPQTSAPSVSSVSISSGLSSPTAFEYDQSNDDYTTLDYWGEYVANIGELHAIPDEPTYIRYRTPYAVSQKNYTHTVGTATTSLTVTLPDNPIEMGSIFTICPYVSSTAIGDRSFHSGYGIDGTSHKILQGDASALYTDAIEFSANYATGVVLFNFLNSAYIAPGQEIEFTYNQVLTAIAGMSIADSLTATNALGSDISYDTWYGILNHDYVTQTVSSIPPYLLRYPVEVTVSPLTTFDVANDFYVLAYEPEVISSKLDLSSYQISPVFYDNYQSSYHTPKTGYTVVRYHSNLPGLSGSTNAGLYNLDLSAWIDGNDSEIVIFDDRFGSRSGTVMVQISSLEQSGYVTKHVPIGLNADLSPIVLYSSDTTNDSVTLSVISIEPISAGTLVTWNVEPPDNIVLTSLQTGSTVPLGTAVPFSSAGHVIATNMGIGTTVFTFSAAGFDGVGQTFWVPSNYNNISLQIDPNGALDNEPLVRTLPMRARLYKNGLPYSLSNGSIVKWECINAPGTIYGTNLSGDPFDFGYYTASVAHKSITANLVAPEVDSNPQILQYDIRATVKAQHYEVVSNTLPVFIDEFPSGASKPINFDVLATTVNPSGVWITNSDEGEDILRLLGTYTFEFSANDIPGVGAEFYDWTIGNLTATSAKSVTAEFVAGVPTLSSIKMCVRGVLVDGWEYTHTICDELQISFVSANEVLDAHLYPSWTFTPSPVKLTPSTYQTATRGVTAYNNGHTEVFNLSCTPQFSAYEVTLDNIVGDFERTMVYASNKISFPIASGDMGVYPIGTTVSVQGYNRYYTRRMPSSVIDDDGTLISLSTYKATPIAQTNALWHNPKYKPYETISVGLSASAEINATADDGYFVVHVRSTNPEPTSPVILNGDSICSIVVDNEDWTETATLPFTAQLGTQTFYSYYQTVDPDAPQFVPDDIASVIGVSAQGTIYRQIGHVASGPWYPDPQTVAVTTVASAYPQYPSLEVFGAARIGVVGEDFTVCNVTRPIGLTASDFSAYSVDLNGIEHSENITQSVTSFDALGTYYVDVTGYKYGGQQVLRTFGPLAQVESLEPFNNDIVRHFYETPTPPHRCEDIVVTNKIANYGVLNQVLEKLYADFEYYKERSKAYSSLLPYALDSWFGHIKSSGTVRWHTFDKAAYQQVRTTKNLISDVRDALVFEVADEGLYTLLINGKSLDFYHNSVKKRSVTQVAPNDLFIDPIRIGLLSNSKVIVLDAGTRNLYAFDLNRSTYDFNIAYYIGGLGDKSNTEGFAEVVDMYIDDKDNIYVTDRGNRQVRKYNSTFGWINSYEFDDMEGDLVGATADENGSVYALTTTGKVYVFSVDGSLREQFAADIIGTPKGISYCHQKGFLNIAAEKMVYKYSTTGQAVGSFDKLDFSSYELIKTNSHIKIDAEGAVTRDIISHLIADRGIFATVDYAEYFNVRHTEFDSQFIPLEDIRIRRDEGMTDWTLNSSFYKVFMNLDLLYKSIFGKYVVYKDYQTGLPVLHAIRTLLLSEKDELRFTCDLTIHVNEPLKDVVIRRVLDQFGRIFDRFDQLLSISQTSIPCRSALCWSWDSLTSGNPQTRNCYSNPITGFELQSDSESEFEKTWDSATGGCCN